jgi:hypothetical protein
VSAFLQTTASDFDLSSGNLQVVSSVALITAQKLTNRFQFFLGEWFVDTRQGVPYFQQVFLKNPNLSAIGQMFRRILLQTPGVASVVSADLSLISQTRTLTATFTVMCTDGSELQGGLGVPFIVVIDGTGL